MGWILAGGVDLNATPSSASSGERPDGQGTGGGLLEPISGSTNPPPYNLQGTEPEPPFPTLDDVSGSSSHISRGGSTPKMDFPKFDGVNPRLWKEQCEIYFKIYGVFEFMKPRFATLNFVGSEAIWLQSV